MICRNCGRIYPPGTRFCAHCGAALDAATGETTGTSTTASDAPGGQPQGLSAEVRRLNILVTLLSDRLAVVERRQGIPAQPAPEQPTAFAPPTPKPIPAPTPVPTPVPAAPVKPVVEQWRAAVTEPPTPREPSAIEREWEQVLGGNWLARLGVLSLIIGTGFFLKFAFDRNWLGPAARVMLGMVGGLVLLFGGHYWHKKYPIFAQALSGGGIAMSYLSMFAAYAFFGLIGFYVSVATSFVISAASASLALRYDSMALAILGIIGAFIAPYLPGVAATGAGQAQVGSSVWLIVYTIVVDIGVLGLSTFRNWRWFTLLALVGSLFAFAVWHDRFGGAAGLLVSEISLSIIFLIFVGATMLHSVVWRRAPGALDYSVMTINATAYFSASYALLYTDARAWVGSFTFLLALFYGGLAYLARRRNPENLTLALYTLGIALVFLTVAIPVQIGDKAWTTVAWSAQATVLMWLACRRRVTLFRVASHLAFLAVAVRLASRDTVVNTASYVPMLNERSLAFIVAIAALYVSGHFMWRVRDTMGEGWETVPGRDFRFLIAAANIFTLWIIAAEVNGYATTSAGTREWLLVFPIGLAGATVLYHLAWRRTPEVFDIAVLVADSAAYLILITFVWTLLRPWIGSFFFSLALFHFVLSHFASRRGPDYRWMMVFALGLELLFLTVAIPTQIGDKAWTTVAWAVEAALLVWLSFRIPRPELRVGSYVVFAVAADRLLFFDINVDVSSFVPLLNLRFLAYAAVVAAMYGSVYVLWRNKKSLWAQERSFWSVYPILLLAANFFTVLLFSLEAWDFFSRQIIGSVGDPASASSLRSARNLSLTAVWALYAVAMLVAGIRTRSRLLRLGGLGLLSIPIIKVYVYDVFALHQIYRIIAFVGLGILLVVSGYLYQRYRGAIRGFIAEKV